MRTCPVDLERCDRPLCSSGICKKSGEYVLAPCIECGTLIIMRGMVICIDCSATVDSGRGRNDGSTPTKGL